MLLIGLLLIYGLSAQDVQENANYTIIQLDICPDEGYIFKKEVSLNGTPGACNLCFCGSVDNAVCWKRDYTRCDAEKYHMHGIGKRNARITRSLGFADIFLRDATREIFNRQEPQQCIPFKESKSEGCPPADWCLGCTVCDCDANGRWACHTLSFCNDKKSKKKQKPQVRLDLLEYPLPQPSKSTPKPPKTTTLLKMKWKRVRSPEEMRKRNLRKQQQQQQLAIINNSNKAMSNSQAKLSVSSNKNTSKNVTKRIPPKKGTVSVQKSNKTRIFTNNLSAKKVIKNNTRKFTNKDTKIHLENDQKTKSFAKQLNTNVMGKQPLFKNELLNELSKDNRTAAVAQKVMESIMTVLKKMALRDIAKQRLDQAVKNAKKGGLFKDNKWRNCTLANKVETVTHAPINIQDFFNKINFRLKRQVNDSYAVLKLQNNITDISNHTITFDIPIPTTESHIPSTVDISNHTSNVTSKNTTQANDNYYTYSVEKANVTKRYQINQDNETVTVFELKTDGEKTDNSDKTTSGIHTTLNERSIRTKKISVTESDSIKSTTNALNNMTNSVYTNQVTTPFNIVKIIFPKNIEKKIVQDVSLKKYFKVTKNKLCNVKMNDSKLIQNCKILTKEGKKKTLKTNILSYLKKIFKNKLYFPQKNKIVKIKQTPGTYNRVLNILCNKYDLCGSEIKPSPQLESKLKKLSKEGNQIMKSIKIIAGLLKLIDLPNMFNRSTEEVGNIESRRQSDIESLYYILSEKYNKENYKMNLTETQLNQIDYIKINTQVFINSVNKFTRILNDIVQILSQDKTETKNENKIHSITEAELKDELKAFSDDTIVKNQNNANNKIVNKKIKNVSKQQNVNKTNKSNTVLMDQLKKMKVLFQNYNKIQNNFFKKVIESLENLRGSSINSITTEAGMTKSLNKSTQIDIYSSKIIQNLKKLKDLASKLDIKRTKRSAMNENELDYMLTLMENLMKKTAFPAHDGIDLLIEVIKQAPEIKKIKYFSPITMNPDEIKKFNLNKWIQITKASQEKTMATEPINKSDSSLFDDNSIESTSEINYKDDGDTESAVIDYGDQNQTLERNGRQKLKNSDLKVDEKRTFPKIYDYMQSVVNENKLDNDVNNDRQTGITQNEISTKVSVYGFKPYKSAGNNDLINNTDNSKGANNEKDMSKIQGRVFSKEDGLEDVRKEFYNADSKDDDGEYQDYSTPKLLYEIETEPVVSSKSDSNTEISPTHIKTRYGIKRKPTPIPSFKFIQWFEDSNEENATRTTPRIATRTRKDMKVTPTPTRGLSYSKNKKNEVLQKKQLDLLKSLDYETEKVDRSDEPVIKWVETNKDKISSEVDDNIANY